MIRHGFVAGQEKTQVSKIARHGGSPAVGNDGLMPAGIVRSEKPPALAQNQG